MKIEEAIKSMRNLDDVISITASEHESVKLAIEALEKQIAKKPIMTPALGAARGQLELECPSCHKMMGWCGKEMISKYQSYCHHCGQYLSSKEV